ncbi:hypothetical protein KEM48_003816 [Puccinia striiformis f. sp. tritici PST-130]|nr:hypothetical protein KEM48_003816 [Puccinia striiformis f. sp. tritici PST-130]
MFDSKRTYLPFLFVHVIPRNDRWVRSSITMLRPYVYGYLQQQQEEFQGSLQHRRTHIEALNRLLDEQLTQSAADMDREEKEAIALIITLGHLGTPGLFRQI